MLTSVCFETYNTSHACAEKLLMQEFMTDIIQVSVSMSPEEIHLI